MMSPATEPKTENNIVAMKFSVINIWIHVETKKSSNVTPFRKRLKVKKNICRIFQKRRLFGK